MRRRDIIKLIAGAAVAWARDITVPPSLLARADEVIEFLLHLNESGCGAKRTSIGLCR
jgi:hypothetical protein